MKLLAKSTLLAVLHVLLLAACALNPFDDSAPAATPTPLGDTLSFLIPAYAVSLNPGDAVPGTRLRYISRVGDTYQVTIDGLEATKRAGDSFIWNGVLAPGVHGSFNLRLIMAVFGPLNVAGPVTITLFYPAPVEASLPTELSDPLAFSNIVVNYLVPVGRSIPGTTLVYQGLTTQGEVGQTGNLAQLSGLSGYPYLALGDSLVWSGRLRDNVYLRYSLRVASLNENGLRLGGTAQLWIVTGDGA
jgi:hypothetical protein